MRTDTQQDTSKDPKLMQQKLHAIKLHAHRALIQILATREEKRDLTLQPLLSSAHQNQSLHTFINMLGEWESLSS